MFRKITQKVKQPEACSTSREARANATIATTSREGPFPAAAAGNNASSGSRPLSNHVPRGCTKPFPNPHSDNLIFIIFYLFFLLLLRILNFNGVIVLLKGRLWVVCVCC